MRLQYVIMCVMPGLLNMLCKTVGGCVSALLMYPVSFSSGYFTC